MEKHIDYFLLSKYMLKSVKLVLKVNMGILSYYSYIIWLQMVLNLNIYVNSTFPRPLFTEFSHNSADLCGKLVRINHISRERIVQGN